MDLATTLKEFREQHGMEQEELARLLETTQQTVSNWENGTLPRSSALRRISHLLQTYRKGEAAAPFPPKPAFDPAIRAIHDIPVNSDSEAQASRPSQQPWALGLPSVKTIPREAQPVLIGGERKVFVREIHDRLPPDLSVKVEEVVEHHGLKTRIDLINDLIACAVTSPIRVDPVSPDLRHVDFVLYRSADQHIMRLSTLRAMHRLQRNEREVYALLLVVPEELASRTNLNRVLTLAFLHDVRVVPVSSVQQGADAFLALHNDARSARDTETWYDFDEIIDADDSQPPPG